MKKLIPALAAVTILCACGKQEDAKAPPPAPVQPAPAAGPLTYEKKTPQAEVKLVLPTQVGALPALYAKLYAEGRNQLDAFAEGAVEDVESLKAEGMQPQPYAQELSYSAEAETARILSLKLTGYEYTGGAHPNPFLSAFTWDKAEGRQLKVADLLKPGANLAAADKALCDAARAAKRERNEGDDTFAGEPIACPTLAKAEVALVPSLTEGKIGGLKVLIGPYEIGPYAEGSYEIVLPLTVFQGLLAPAYAAEFAGSPKPEPKAE